MRRLTALLVSAALALALASTALANYVPGGGKWNISDIRICDNSSYRTYVSDGAARWNAARSDWSGKWPTFGFTSRDQNTGECTDYWHVTAYNIEDPSGAYAYGFPLPYGGPFTYGYLEMNTARLGSLSDSDKKYMALHEMGHILGLGHNTNIWPDPSVMSTLYWYNAVYQHDVGDLNNLYQ